MRSLGCGLTSVGMGSGDARTIMGRVCSPLSMSNSGRFSATGSWGLLTLSQVWQRAAEMDA